MYRDASICRNGHVINIWGAENPDQAKKFCPQCGDSAVQACESCGSHIDGMAEGEWQSDFWKFPYFCPECGTPYPWASAKLNAARELANEIEGLDDEERERLKKNLADLVANTPRTEVAVVQTKKLLGKARGEAVGAFVDVLRAMARDEIRRNLFGA